MSGIAGIFRRDGAPVYRELLERMARSMAYRGRDGIAYWLDGPVGLVQLTTTPAPPPEGQRPSVEANDRYVAVFAGHIDNPEELEAELPESAGTQTGDAALLLRAFAKWGDATPEKIVGPFAFAIWDRERRRLFCARDFRGARPLYYHLTERLVLFASDFHALFQERSLSRRANEGVVAEFLSVALTTRQETFFTDVSRLVPGQWLAVERDSRAFGVHWQPPVRLLEFSSESEAAEQLRALLVQATRGCLRGHSRAAVQLSGGIDSTSVLLLARALAPPEGVEAGSLVFPTLGDCDESAQIDAVSAASPGPAFRLAFRPVGIDPLFRWSETTLDVPDSPNGTMHYPLLDELRARGHRLLMSGDDGDAWLTGSAYQYSDTLRQLDLKAFWQLFVTDPGTTRNRLGRLSRYVLGPLAPARVRRRFPRLFVPPEDRPPATPTWIDPAFSARTSLEERLRCRPPAPRFPTRVQAQMYRGGFTAWQDCFSEIIERTAARQGLETRSPFSDRRLVEFAFRLPDRLRWRGGLTKLILRRALQDALPPPIRDRADKAEYSGVFAEEYGTGGFADLARESKLEARGWIRPGAAAAQLRSLRDLYGRGDGRYRTFVWGTYVLVSLEIWLRAAVRE